MKYLDCRFDYFHDSKLCNVSISSESLHYVYDCIKKKAPFLSDNYIYDSIYYQLFTEAWKRGYEYGYKIDVYVTLNYIPYVYDDFIKEFVL